MITTVLFDFDGTLVDSESLHFQCWNNILAPYGIAYDEVEFCQRYSGRPTLASAKEVVTQHNLAISAEALAQQKNDQFAKVAATSLPRLMPYALEILQHCREDGFKIGLVTGSTRDEVMPILHGYELAEYFACVVTKDDVSEPKPAPQPYLLGLSLLGANAQQSLAIEDTHTGSMSAKSAGLRVAVVPNTHTLTQDFSHADGRFANLADLYQQLLQIRK